MSFSIAMGRLLGIIRNQPDEVIQEKAEQVAARLQFLADKATNDYLQNRNKNEKAKNIYSNTLSLLEQTVDQTCCVLQKCSENLIDIPTIKDFRSEIADVQDDASKQATILKAVTAALSTILTLLTLMIGILPLDMPDGVRWAVFIISGLSLITAGVTSVFLAKDDQNLLQTLMLELAAALSRLNTRESMEIREAEVAIDENNMQDTPSTLFYRPKFYIEKRLPELTPNENVVESSQVEDCEKNLNAIRATRI